MNEYLPPFPYFGGKSKIAPLVWEAFGDIENYVEPFAGSLAVLMLRPGFDWERGTWESGDEPTETVNDADGFIANFWRATKHAPEEVARFADHPVNEADLHARHVWLLGQRERITERLMGDPDFFDAKAAGWWCWGMCCWIGSGWCSGTGPWRSVNGVFTLDGNAGRGVNRKLPHLDTCKGVNRKLPDLDTCKGVEASYRDHMIRYFRLLWDRLRRVRVCCGDWSRVCGYTPTINHGVTGVFLDPPYSAEAGRDMDCYAVDSGEVAHRVREWALEHGNNPLYRIVLAGYEGEHAMPDSWRCVAWKTRGGYGNQGHGPGRENAARERLWLSPHCADHAAHDLTLFAEERRSDG